MLRKQELEHIQLLQQLNQLDTGIQHDLIPPVKTKMIPTTSKKVPPQQIKSSGFSIPTPFVFHAIIERHK